MTTTNLNLAAAGDPTVTYGREHRVTNEAGGLVVVSFAGIKFGELLAGNLGNDGIVTLGGPGDRLGALVCRLRHPQCFANNFVGVGGC